MTTKFFSDQMDAENERQRTATEIEREQQNKPRNKRKHIDQRAADYRPTRGTIDDPNRSGADSILRAVDKGGEITLPTLTELIELLRTKTDYHFHIEVAVLPSKSALLKTIDNERDALETIRRLKAKP